MSNVLDDILEAKKKSLSVAKERISLEDLERELKKHTKIPTMVSSLREAEGVAVIAEMKKKSPSAGILCPDYEVRDIAKAYKKGGASALSVLTEFDYFGGSLEDIQSAKSTSGLPVLRKDFIFEPYQIFEAKVFGADAVLLIADMLEKDQLRDLVLTAIQVGVEPLVEIFSKQELDSALKTGAAMIGINTRNLRTLEMIPDNVSKLAPLIPKDRLVIAESGIKSRGDIESFVPLGVRAVLIGEYFLKQKNREEAVQSLVGVTL